MDPGFTQGTANLQLGRGKGEKRSLLDPVSAVKSHYRGNCFCSTLISYQFGLGIGRKVFLLVLFLNSKNTAFKNTQHRARMTGFFNELFIRSSSWSSEDCKKESAVRGSSHGSHWELLGAQLTRQNWALVFKCPEGNCCMAGSWETLGLGTCQAFKSGCTQNEGAEYFPHQTDVKQGWDLKQ